MKKILLLVSCCIYSLMGYSQSLHFDGVDDYVQPFGGYITTNGGFSATAVTFECWVNGAHAPTIGSAQNGPVYAESFGISWDNGSGYHQAAFVRASDGQYYAASFGNLNSSTWYHLAATYDGSDLKSYVNGALLTTTTTPGGIYNSEVPYLEIGKHAVNPSYFEGQIDEVRIWNVARTCNEINQNMNNANMSGSQTGLLAYYQFSNGTPNGNNATQSQVLNTASGSVDANLYNFALTGTTSNYVAESPLNATLNSCGATSIVDPSDLIHLHVYPNPTSSVLFVKAPEKTTVKVMNLLGATLISKRMNSQQDCIDVTGLPSGVYFLITDNREAIRFIKE